MCSQDSDSDGLDLFVGNHAELLRVGRAASIQFDAILSICRMVRTGCDSALRLEDGEIVGAPVWGMMLNFNLHRLMGWFWLSPMGCYGAPTMKPTQLFGSALGSQIWNFSDSNSFCETDALMIFLLIKSLISVLIIFVWNHLRWS